MNLIKLIMLSTVSQKNQSCLMGKSISINLFTKRFLQVMKSTKPFLKKDLVTIPSKRVNLKL